MTLDKLLTISADDWDKLSDAELTKILEPLFNVTRPDLQKVADKLATKQTTTRVKKPKLDEMLALARSLGVKV